MDSGQYARLIAETCERLGFDDVQPDESGFCTLDFGGIFLNCSASTDFNMVRITAPVAEIEGECPRRVLERLLEAHLFFKDTRGATFSYVKESGAVLLHLNLMLDHLDAIGFEKALKNCVSIAVEFSKEIFDLLREDKASDSSPEAGSTFGSGYEGIPV